ncbi:MAG: hypothetical protein ACO1QR_03675 [Chthoniobacteraceae bacterium]
MQSYKNEIRRLLQLLASEEEQLAYERNVPRVDITAELLCMWFDDFYDGEQVASDPAFSVCERQALDEFHQFYDAKAELLPESHGTVRTWLATPEWREVMEQAQRTLSQIESKPTAM